jgi:kynureninase
VISGESGHHLDSAAFAADMDKRDHLSHSKSDFHFPKVEGKDVIYLCGNSLGLQPRATRGAILEELDDWACTLP